MLTITFMFCVHCKCNGDFNEIKKLVCLTFKTVNYFIKQIFKNYSDLALFVWKYCLSLGLFI